eukprot:618684-Amorphochlora_amoeboformis.AAC.1
MCPFSTCQESFCGFLSLGARGSKFISNVSTRTVRIPSLLHPTDFKKITLEDELSTNMGTIGLSAGAFAVPAARREP